MTRWGWAACCVAGGMVILSGGAEARLLSSNMHCLKDWKPEAASRAVGVETVDQQPDRTVTIFVALPKNNAGRIWDLNALTATDSLPTRFVLTDGSLLSAFVSVDLRPHSRLNECLDELQADLLSRLDSHRDAVEVLRDLLNDYLRPQPEGFRYPWQEAADPAVPREYDEAANLPAGHYPLATPLRLPLVPLESFLWAGRGVCMERVMLSSLLLRRLGIAHVMRAGATADGGGHIWIELPDGRHLDPTWNLVAPAHPLPKQNWFHFGRTDLYRNSVYPFTVDQD